ncbi:MAG TPA: hypothetical protein VFD70_24460 [Anaerolineae bacterium]|nr:hypothetical protein [Anaerolineae bacterium]
MENNADSVSPVLAARVDAERIKKKRNNQWARSRVMVNKQTGEVLSGQNCEALTVADISRGWYSEQGARNNARLIVKRLKKSFQFECDLKKYRPKFITLTFADIDDSWLVEKAVRKFLDAVRHWAKRSGVNTVPYFWSGEVQERGALHYHILLLGLPYLDKELIQSWWSHGFVDIRAVDDMGRAFKYVAKYLWKWGKLAAEPDALPDWWFYFGIYSKRRYGFSKFYQLPPLERMPRWLRDVVEQMDAMVFVARAGPADGGGWEITFKRDYGDVSLHFDSPFVLKEM